jgi:lipid II:glycine glycyltransferase (peptidoglycan interpeptide bridge formation enzyme)
MPNHLIQWRAIEWAAAAGYRIYDFRGVSEHVPGLKRFKEGFGARAVTYAGEFDLPLRAGWYRLWLRGAPAAIALRQRLRGGATEAAD